MVKRPAQYGAYRFAVLSGLRVAQLVRGSVPRVVVGQHKLTTTAQMEVAEMKVLEGTYEDGSVPAGDTAAPDAAPELA
jgi:hypothetical protein